MFINEEITISSLPKIDEINFKSIDKNYLNVLLLGNGVQYVVLFCAVLLLKNFLAIALLEHYFVEILIVYSIGALVHLLLSIVGFWRRKYGLRKHDVSYKRGVLLSSLSTVPFSRIQHLDITQGIVSRKLGLANLKLYTAGDKGSDMVIHGLLLTDAEKIKAYITEQING